MTGTRKEKRNIYLIMEIVGSNIISFFFSTAERERERERDGKNEQNIVWAFTVEQKFLCECDDFYLFYKNHLKYSFRSAFVMIKTKDFAFSSFSNNIGFDVDCLTEFAIFYLFLAFLYFAIMMLKVLKYI